MSRGTVFALADDLTGALEVGAKFAERGIHAIVTLDTPCEDAGVTVVDTETRHCTPDEAGAKVLRIAAHARDANLIYKKTDSTLRGNVAAEFDGLLRAFPAERIAFVPAYPAMGRTVAGGELLVDGVPVHATEFGADSLNPIRDSSVKRLVAGLAVDVFDGAVDEDVARVARSIIGGSHRLAAGPSALAEQIAACFAPSSMPLNTWPRVTRALIVNGSRHPVSCSQVEHFQRKAFDPHWSIHSHTASLAGPLEVARDRAAQVRQLLATTELDALIVFGGDTAHAVACELGCRRMDPVGEIIKGVPVCRIRGPRKDLYLITKAGGFGAPDLLTTLKEKLRGE